MRLTGTVGPVKRAYLHTFTLEMLVLGGQLVTYRLAADYFSSLGFSEYALSRRVLSLLHPALMLGVGIALPRYAARASGATRRTGGYLQAGTLIVGMGLAVWLVGLLTWDRAAAGVLFGDERYAPFIPAVGAMLAGLSVHVLAYVYLRGTLRIRLANWMQAVNLGLAPPLVFIFPGRTVAALLTSIGAAWFAVSAPVLGWLLLREGRPRGMGGPLREMLGFGIQRVPGEFLQMALFGLPGIVVAHLSGVEVAGRVAFAMSVLNMFGSVFVPIGLVLLPVASQMIGAADLQGLGSHVRRLTLAILAAAIPAAVIAEVLARFAIEVYLGSGFGPTVGLVRLAVLGVVPVALYMALRSVIDAVYERALNTRNLAAAFLTLAIAAVPAVRLMGPPAGILVGVTLAFYVLGGATVRDALRGVTRRGAT